VDFLTLTYKDNEALDERIVKSIESRKGNKNWWRVYGLGLLGEVEGKIYTDWQIIDFIPHEARLERYGLDFGYTNDPSAIIAVYKYNGAFLLDEIAYQKGLSNKNIADILHNQKPALTIADSAEPKSIDEISSYGVSILPSKKGQGSVLQSIQYVQQQRISMTKRSLNLIKDYRNFMWKTDKDGKILNEPERYYKHSMDAIAYAINDLKSDESFVTNYDIKRWGIK
jgi:phage terminase large subunit